MKRRFEEIKSYLIKHENIADLGIGKGYYYSGVDIKNVVGVDLDHKNLERVKRDHPKIEVIEKDVRNTGLPDKSFDLVVITQVIEHFEDYIPVVKEAKRICKDDGYFLIGVPIEEYDKFNFYPVWTEDKARLLANEFGDIIDIKNLESCWLMYIKNGGTI